MSDYNTYYKEKESYFGNPYTGFVDFFRNYKNGSTVLDLGCGQGRDAIALGRLGYEVMGVDNSKVGVEQMLEIARKENLKVLGKVGDIYTSDLIPNYDIILLDSIFHFYKKDKEKEITFFAKILQDMKKGAAVCVMILKSPVSEKIISTMLANNSFLKIEDTYIDYAEFNATYRMFIYEK